MTNLSKLEKLTTARNKAKLTKLTETKKKNDKNDLQSRILPTKSVNVVKDKVISGESLEGQKDINSIINKPKKIEYVSVEEKPKSESLTQLLENALQNSIKVSSQENPNEKPKAVSNNSKVGIVENKNLLGSNADESKSESQIIEDELRSNDKTSADIDNDTDKDDENLTNEKTVPNSVDELIGGLVGISDKYEGKTDRDYYADQLVDVPEGIDIEGIEEPEIDLVKLKEEIEGTEKNKIEIEKNKLREEYAELKDKKEQEADDTVESSREEEKEVNAILDAERVIAENDITKRGLARSSIAILRLGDIEDTRANQLIEVNRSLTEKLNIVENDIKKLNSELDYSLENLDLELAINISNELEKKVSELKEEQKKAIEFNNNIEKMRAEYQLKRQDSLTKRNELEDELSQKYEGIVNKMRTDEMIKLTNNYLYSLPRTQAIAVLIGNGDIHRYLGDAFYDLYYEQMRRER